jgi:hypothetical protein
LRVTRNADHRLVVAPAARLTPDLRAAIQAHRAALLALVQAERPTDPDRWSWPHSPAATTSEVQTMAARLALFAARGLSLADAERLADKLLLRDREGDHRGACAECARLVGTDPSRWKCSDRHRTNELAGLPVAALLVHQHLHHCTSRATH